MRIAAGTWQRLIREICLIAAFAVIYEVIRDNMAQAGSAAAGHASLIVSAEQALGLFREHAVQSAIIGNDTVTDAFNAYYGGTHFLIPALVLLRALAVAYPLMTTLVVVATGNHFFLDVIAGALLACVTWIGVTWAGAWLTVRMATWRAHRGQHSGSPAVPPARYPR